MMISKRSPILILICLLCALPVIQAETLREIDGVTVIEVKSVKSAIKLMKAGEWDAARVELEAIVAKNPSSDIALFDLGIAYEKLDQRDAAKEMYKRAISVDIDQIYLEALARVQGKTGYGAAMSSRLIRCYGPCSYGFQYAKAGLWSEAIPHFKNAYDRDPTNANACFNLSVAYEIVGQHDLAIEHCRQAIVLKSNPLFIDFLDLLENSRKQTTRN